MKLPPSRQHWGITTHCSEDPHRVFPGSRIYSSGDRQVSENSLRRVCTGRGERMPHALFVSNIELTMTNDSANSRLYGVCS